MVGGGVGLGNRFGPGDAAGALLGVAKFKESPGQCGLIVRVGDDAAARVRGGRGCNKFGGAREGGGDSGPAQQKRFDDHAAKGIVIRRQDRDVGGDVAGAEIV